ncbi:MAG: PTS transporter subunit EIIC [Trichococcus sp.]|uniref:PTS sugar transporter subunit IIC n=1 Tax=Trichococcus sp. TaxID=1985464 RepID=UPI003C5FE8A0
MKIMDKLQASLEKIMGPIAQKLSESKILSAFTAGMMHTMPISLGVAGFAILASLPIEPWQNFLTSTGIGQNMLDIVAATSSLMALFIAPAIAYFYAKNEEENGLIASLLATASFLALQPVRIIVGESSVSGLLQENLGSKGIFIAMITSMVVSFSYCKLIKKNFKLKLPESVPPNVSESLSPTFVSMIIFFGVFVVRWLASLTPAGDIFTLFNSTIALPIMGVGATPLASILVLTFATLCWFFGIHPAPIMNIYYPVIIVANTANLEAYLAGTPSSQLPYLAVALVSSFCYIGGQGNTLALSFLLFKAKSERYRALRKVAVIPNIFNINEPMIFGMPVMLNAYFFIPMISTVLFGGAYGWFVVNLLHVGDAFNPTIALPWVMPSFIGPFLTGGWRLGIATILALFIQIFIWYPFFRMADNQALKEESESQTFFTMADNQALKEGLESQS